MSGEGSSHGEGREDKEEESEKGLKGRGAWVGKKGCNSQPFSMENAGVGNFMK